MSVCVVGRVQKKLDSDRRLFSIEWADLLDTGIGRHMPVIDRIATSTWAFDGASPAATGVISADGFDESSATTWLTVGGGVDGDVFWINNTITTTGACINGKNTPPQQLERQIRIRIESC